MIRTIIQSFIVSLLICGCLILLNYMCPFLSIKTDPVSYDSVSDCFGTHKIGQSIWSQYYSNTTYKYIGIFGVDNITHIKEDITDTRNNKNNNYDNELKLNDDSNINNNSYIQTDTYKKLNWITISIEFTVVYIILFIIFYKQDKNLYSIYSEDV